MWTESLAQLALYSYLLSCTLLVASLLLAWYWVLSGVGRRPVAAPGCSPNERPLLEAGGRAAPVLDAGRWLLWLALGALTLALLARGLAAQRPPFASQYEFAVAFAWGALASHLWFARRGATPGLALIVPALALGLLLYASTLPVTLLPLVPALQNRFMLTVHVGSALVAYGANAVAAGAGALFLAQLGIHARTGHHSSLLPHPQSLDELGYRAVMVSFPMLALTLLLGSWWAYTAWGYYWNWDPKETATLATWLVYGAYIHTRMQREWQGKASAVLLLVGFALTVFTYVGNLFFQSLHSFSGV